MKEMTPVERLNAAIALEYVDRPPVTVLLGGYAATCSNTPVVDFYSSTDVAEAAFDKTWEALGGMDIVFPVGMAQNNYIEMAYAYPTYLKLPGRDLPETSMPQVIESEFMSVDEYKKICDQGFPGVFMEITKRTRKEIDPAEVEAAPARALERRVRWTKKWNENGFPSFRGGAINPPFEFFGFARGLPNFMKDLFRYPEMVQEAIEVALPFVIESGKRAAKATGVPRIWVITQRGCMVSRRHFERFVFPSLQKIVDEFWKEGIVTCFHSDGDWTPYLDYFRDFPKGSCLKMLDGMTDIQKAISALKGRMCIMGDVHPSLLSIGKPEEVYRYCRDLIEQYGHEGGLILASGCEVPANAKFENVKAIILAGKGLSLE